MTCCKAGVHREKKKRMMDEVTEQEDKERMDVKQIALMV